jgi:Zn-dependent M28 family amino/carboxypeptidase
MLAATTGESDEYLLLGAHYDHLGFGGGGNSLAEQGDEPQVHPGADDNASGVATILETLDQLVEADRSRNVVAGFWSGEELGLIGSTAFVDDQIIPNDHIIANINLDMVGNVTDNTLVVQGVGSSDAWPEIVERANIRVGFDLTVSEDPYLPTDASAFYQKEIPILNLFTGAHERYHKPVDTPDTLNYEGMDRVVDFAASVSQAILREDDAPTYVAYARTIDDSASMRSVRVYTGTIPDYATDVEGLKLSGVMKDGPAEKAGLKAEDVIVEFAGQTIANIYDYTFALETVKIDEPVPVVVMRESERIELEIVPTVRR